MVFGANFVSHCATQKGAHYADVRLQSPRRNVLSNHFITMSLAMRLHVNIITIWKRENVIMPCIFEPLLELGYKASAARLFESTACC